MGDPDLSLPSELRPSTSAAAAATRAAVVVPTRNRRPLLERAIASVRAQTLRDWELIVVDDASEDRTWELLGGVDDPRLRPVRLDAHRERSAARNEGLRHVTAPAVVFLDDDDELVPKALERLVAALEGEPSACASVGAVVHDVDGALRRPPFPTQPTLAAARDELLAGWVALGGQSLIRTGLLREVGEWNEDLAVAEDQELWLRLVGRGPIAIVPDTVLRHRPHGVARDVPWGRDVERGVVAAYLAGLREPPRRATQAALAREHLRDAFLASERGAHRAALLATARGVRAAPFLLRSPLTGPGLRRALLNGTASALLPVALSGRIRDAVRRRRARSLSRDGT